MKKKEVLSEKKETKYIHFYKSGSRIIYWMTLLVLTVCNFLVTLALIPFILFLDPLQIYFTVGLLGLVFGLLFNMLVRDIEHLRVHHHMLAIIFIPIMALINFYVISSIVTRITEPLGLTKSVNPLLLGLVYAVIFLLPYITNAVFSESLIKKEHF